MMSQQELLYQNAKSEEPVLKSLNKTHLLEHLDKEEIKINEYLKLSTFNKQLKENVKYRIEQCFAIIQFFHKFECIDTNEALRLTGIFITLQYNLDLKLF